MKPLLALAGVAIALTLAGCGGGETKATPGQSGDTLAPGTQLIDLEHPDRSSSLFSLFNDDQGVPRLVLLVSPT